MKVYGTVATMAAARAARSTVQWRFTEIARFKAIEGKTWNHPALVGLVRLVRNGEEIPAFRLILAGR
jgi:hypothetical protein